MSIDDLMLTRPLYSPNQKRHPFTVHTHNQTPYSITTQISPQDSPRIGDLSTIHKFADKILPKQISELMKIDDRTRKQKKEKVKEAYNLLSDFSDKNQIIRSLKSLHSADERIALIDKILERKEEMQIATLKLKAKKLEPLFNVIRRKLKKKQRKQTTSVERQQQKQTIIQHRQNENSSDTNPVQSNRNLDQDESNRKELIIEKIQSKYAASIAFTWLTNRTDKGESFQQNMSPESLKRHERRNTTLKAQFNKGVTGLKQMITKKVSENSDEMIRIGQLKLIQKQSKQYNSKELIAKSKSKIDTGRNKSVQVVRTLKKKQTLDFITNERSEHNLLNEQIINEKNNIMLRRKLMQ